MSKATSSLSNSLLILMLELNYFSDSVQIKVFLKLLKFRYYLHLPDNSDYNIARIAHIVVDLAVHWLAIERSFEVQPPAADCRDTELGLGVAFGPELEPKLGSELVPTQLGQTGLVEYRSEHHKLEVGLEFEFEVELGGTLNYEA